jgi:uncharacterized protein YabE (DUF348 family)
MISSASNLWYTLAVMNLKRIPPSRRILIASILLAIGGLIFIYLATARSVRIFVDNEWLVLNTHARKVGTALEAAGIELREGDQVFPDPSSSLESAEAIEVKRGFTVNLEINSEYEKVITTEKSIADVLDSAGIKILPADRIWVNGIREKNPGKVLSGDQTYVSYKEAESLQLQMDGDEITIRSAANTVGEAITEAGIELLEGDILLPAPETPLTGIDHAILKRAEPVTIVADGTIHETYVVAESVGEALQRAGVTLVGLDYAIPKIEEELPEDGQIQVIRVRDEFLTEQTPIPFETIYVADPDVEIDNRVVIDSGTYGVQTNQVRVRYEDGKENNRTVVGEWVSREPQPRKVGYGTKIVIRTLNTADGPVEYWRAIRMWATSYSPSRAGVPQDYEWFGITACGRKLVKGIVAIDNRYIPFHTMMYVPGYGYAEACDIGGGVIGRWIDLGYSDHNYKSWHQYVTVYFLTPVPPANTIAWIFP